MAASVRTGKERLLLRRSLKSICGGMMVRAPSPAALLLSTLALSALSLSACVTADQSSARPSERPLIAAEQLIGLSSSSLTGALGRPATTRRDSPAEIWQYRSESCILDVFLYEAASGTQVVHLEARDERAEPVSHQECLGSLTRSATTPGSPEGHPQA